MKKCEFCGAEVYTECRMAWVEMPAGETWACTKQMGHEDKCGINPEAHTLLKCRDSLAAKLADARYVLGQVSAARDILMQWKAPPWMGWYDRPTMNAAEEAMRDADEECGHAWTADLEMDPHGNVFVCCICRTMEDVRDHE